MLIELAVRDLGVIADLRLTFEAQMSALTGETGAGKTMLVEALGLLLGAKADPSRVRPGASESVVEGRFVRPDDTEVVLRRVVPAKGRSRCYIDGDMATITALAEAGSSLVEICGQHSQQQLHSTRSQREALDRFAGIDLGPLNAASAKRRELESLLGTLGGDDRTRAREIDLLQFQLEELEAANLQDPDEDEALSREEDVLSDAIAHIEAGAAAMGALHDDGGAADRLAEALAAIAHRSPYDSVAGRLAGLAAELGDAVDELRTTVETIEPDPQRLDTIRSRRQLFVDLRRKYGENLTEVMAYHREVAERLDELIGHDQRAAALDAELAAAIDTEHAERATVHAARRAAAPALAEAIEGHLREVALPNARVEIAVDGDDVEFRLSTNPGMEPQPIAKAASGGELSRTMLAMYQVLSSGAPTMVFDEVDAGIGGSAATAVGQALARLGAERQILVVTHLPQVAAHATAQFSVEKSGETLALTTIRTLDDDERVIELSRMLSGTPDSDAARTHAAELLANAQVPTP
ncbi:MAG: DNA repair protein RecN [Actinobacteria bacterium]|nr:DNA repair protein RecN [Actinomycetota bacterium]